MRKSLPVVVSLLLGLASCLPRSVETSLVFDVEPTDDGASIEVLVEGWPAGEVWIGFGVGPGVPTTLVERVSDVRAWAHDGVPLEVQPHGYAGFGVRLIDNRPWRFSYRLDLRPDPRDATFYRASVRGPDYLVLVGSDAWPRIFIDSRPLSFAPDNRPPGRADAARITLNVDADSDWEVLATADDVTRRSFRFAEHPATTVVLAGTFREPTSGPGVTLRRHDRWRVLPDGVDEMSSTLARALSDRLGAPSPLGALAVMLPLPEEMKPGGGLRTAGMVRGRTVLLYGGLSPGIDPRTVRIREALAVFIGHELFHLYVPTAIPVSRDLSWMSEGWAMHMGRLAARDGGFVDPQAAERQLERTYRRYLDMGGYRAGSLPAASMGSESMRDLLYLRGELVFRLLAREWESEHPRESFEERLWRDLQAIDRDGPLSAEQVYAVLGTIVDPSIVRRYVEGTAPLTQGVLGLER